MNTPLEHIGRFILLAGIILAAIGGLLVLAAKVPWIGKLPGDIIIRKKNFTFYFPLATSILLSILLSFLFYFFSKR
ncbi:MAG: DUF2905 domain-containing protein [Nitrospirota bacterium]|nr:MAG: DUF2905 domain-containing protein [Nitrospirota bacterium]